MKKKFLIALCFVLTFTASAYAGIAPFDTSHFGLTQKNAFRLAANDDENLPVSYDLREYEVVPPIKNQNTWGTCWAFGAMAAIETNYLKQVTSNSIDVISEIGGTSLDVDLSEIHLSYFYVLAPDRKQNFSVVQDEKLEKYPSAAQAFNNGGSIYQPVAVMTRGWGWGPVSVSNDTGLSYHNFDNVTIGSTDVLAVSPDVYTTVLRITEASYFSAFFSEDIMFKNDMNSLKKLIMDRGAIEMTYNDAYDEAHFRNSETGAYFYSTEAVSSSDKDSPADKPNHSVAIIGWDDTFSKDKFNSACQPKNDGAWLVRNSWGTKFANEGYFWVSYEQYMGDGTAFIVQSADKNLRTYYHDDLGWCDSWGNGTTSKAANVFEAKSDGEVLKEIGFYTTENGASVTASVYTYTQNPKNNIESGTLAGTKTATYDFAGYHTMTLDTTVNLDSGDIFAVVLEVTNPSYKYPIAVESRINGYSDNSLTFDGESYFYENGEWADGASLTNLSNDVTLNTPSNACIKAFATCNEEAKIVLESPVEKTINGISVNDIPENLTVSSADIYAKNPVTSESDYTGRKISQVVVDNDGNNLSEGTDIVLYLMYTEEFEEEKPGQASKYGLREIPHEIDPLYPAGFTPSMYTYLPYPDGYIYPSYLAVTSADNNGKVTINADSMNLPTGHYDVIYIVSDDVEAIAGALRSIEITKADITDSQEEKQNESEIEIETETPMIGSSGGGCNAGLLTFSGCAMLVLITMLKSKRKL